MFRASLIIASLTVVTSAAWAQSTTEPLTIDAAVALALDHSRELASAELQVAKTDQHVADARARRLPQLQIELQATELLRPVRVQFPQGAFGSYPSIGPVPSADTAITTSTRPTMILDAQANQPLSQLYEIHLNVQLSETAQALERETVRATRLTLVYEVKRLYYAILQSISAVEASDHSLAMLHELGRVAGDRVARKVALRGDALEIDSRVAHGEHERLTRQHAIASQKEQLNRLLGRDVRTPFELAGIPARDVVETDLALAQTLSLEARPDVRQARLRKAQTEIARRVARADYLPEVSLGLSYLSPMNIDGAPRNIASLALQLKWEPFDWGRKSRAVAAKTIDVRRASLAISDAEDRALLDVNAQYRRLTEVRSELRVAEIAQRAARETSRVRASQYRIQAALLSDVLHAAADESEANNQYQQALAGLWLARADFERALGEDVVR